MFENSNVAALEYIFSFSHSGAPVKDLGRIKRLLSAVGNPQERLRFVHIAGTNGKGSTARMFEGVFTRAGLKTGLFTSPYIIEYSDRIQVNGEYIPPDALSRLADKVRVAVESLPEKEQLSQFEITEAIAFLHFAEQGCDVVVLETGLGGLLDCTNVITSPLLTVITSIGLDHTAILGDTIEQIAAQKAGIIKRGVPCVLSADNCDGVRQVVAARAQEMSSPLFIPDDTLLRMGKTDLTGAFFTYKNIDYSTSMAGAHQVINALSVIEGCHILAKELHLTQSHISEGISAATLPGRTEVLSAHPMTLLDGAHNPDGIRALVQVIKDKHPCHAIIGMCRDKDLAASLKELLPHVDSFITVDGFSDRAESASNLAALINSLGGSAMPATRDLADEIERLRTQNPDGLTLICGSLYLTSTVHELIRNKKCRL